MGASKSVSSVARRRDADWRAGGVLGQNAVVLGMDEARMVRALKKRAMMLLLLID